MIRVKSRRQLRTDVSGGLDVVFAGSAPFVEVVHVRSTHAARRTPVEGAGSSLVDNVVIFFFCVCCFPVRSPECSCPYLRILPPIIRPHFPLSNTHQFRLSISSLFLALARSHLSLFSAHHWKCKRWSVQWSSCNPNYGVHLDSALTTNAPRASLNR